MSNKNIIVGIVVCLVLLAAAAFVGGRLLSSQAGSLGSVSLVDSNGNAIEYIERSITMIPAPEVPTYKAIQMGYYINHNGNNLTLQSISFINNTIDQSGPKLELVITKDTLIYKDVTDLGNTQKTNTVVQQVVESGSVDDIAPGALIIIWGRTSGDRIIGDVIVYKNLIAAP